MKTKSKSGAKKIKVQDLKPKKNPKGGAQRSANSKGGIQANGIQVNHNESLVCDQGR